MLRHAQSLPEATLRLPDADARTDTIQLSSHVPPTGEATIHQRCEPLVVVVGEQMHHFVHDDVLQALAWLLREFRVEANVA
jgi:hypothetical protein